MTPSITPLKTYCARTPASITAAPAPRRRARASRAPGSLAARELALPLGVVAVVPDDPLSVLHDVRGHDRHDVLAVRVEGHRPDDRRLVLGLLQLGGHRLAVGPDLLDRAHEQVRGDERVGA